MAEAVAVIGVVAAAIGFLQAGKKAYDAAHSATKLPEDFAKVAENIPMVKEILENIRKDLQTRHDAAKDAKSNSAEREVDRVAQSVQPIVDTCRDNSEELSLIFQKVMPDDGASLPQRYAAALRSLKPGRGEKVEKLMEEILKKLQLLHTNRYFWEAARSEEELNAAIEQLSKVTSSLPDNAAPSFLHSGRGAINANTGSGNQYNHNLSGDNNTQTNNYGTQ